MINTPQQILRSLFIIVSTLSNCCSWIAYGSDLVREPISFHVGVILNLETPMGNMSNRCISIAVEDFYKLHDHYMTKMVLHTNDSSGVLSAVFAAKELLKNQKVQAIVGPQTSAEADFVAELGNKTQVPVVSFSATSPSISSSQMPYFVRMTQNDTYQLEAIASIVLKFEWWDVILVYEDSDYGSEIIPSLIEVFEANKVRVSNKTAISSSATDSQILEALEGLSAMQTRVFIVHMSTKLGPSFFMKVNEIGLMSEGNAWIITEEMTSVLGSMEDNVLDSMHGVLGITPYIPRSRQMNDLYVRISEKFPGEDITWDDLNIFCLHAYDTIWAIAKAAERVHRNENFRGLTENESMSDIGDFSISELGPQLLEEILNSKFKGLSGDIHLVNGQLQPLIFQIINVVHQNVTEIGFWSPVVELSLGPDGKSPSHLRPIIWPGDSSVVPRTSAKTLKIGYPTKIPFKKFVNVNGSSVAGYCIDVFKAVMEALPYVVPYEFVPFENLNNKSRCSYDDLIHQVFLQKYDAAVGDFTITANRSISVDFSLAYTTGGVAMIIPIKYDKRNNLLIFFKMVLFKIVSSRIGVLCCLVFIITIFLIWLFENGGRHRLSRKKLVTSTWVILSIQVHELRKAPVMVVFLVVTPILIWNGLLILVLFKQLFGDSGQLITVEAKDLVKSGEFVGYQKGSYVKTVLEHLNFEKSKIKVYNSPREYDEALEKGSKNGGVAAIFDEIPYINGILHKFCHKYRRVGPIYRMDGFGFVFPRGSALVPDVSRAIISLMETGKLAQIERFWFEREKPCPVPPKTKSNPLYIEKYPGLYLIVSVLILTHILPLLVMFNINKRSNHRILGTPNEPAISIPSVLETDTVQERPDSVKNSERSDVSSLASEIIKTLEVERNTPNDPEQSNQNGLVTEIIELLQVKAAPPDDPKQSDLSELVGEIMEQLVDPNSAENPEQSNRGGLVTATVLAPLQENSNLANTQERLNRSDRWYSTRSSRFRIDSTEESEQSYPSARDEH